jgi:hypothetical protein
MDSFNPHRHPPVAKAAQLDITCPPPDLLHRQAAAHVLRGILRHHQGWVLA